VTQNEHITILLIKYINHDKFFKISSYPVFSSIFSSLNAQENAKRPVLKQEKEETILGNNSCTVTHTAALGNGLKLDATAGTRSFESVEQAIARTHARVTQPFSQNSAQVSHGILGLEINSMFTVSDHLTLMLYAGAEARIPISDDSNGMTQNNTVQVVPYAGGRLRYDTPARGSYDATFQLNGTGSSSSQTAIATPLAAPVMIGLGWISGSKKKE